MLRAERIEISPEGRQDHHIGVIQRTIHGDSDTAEGIDRLAVRADQTGFESRGEVKAELFAIAQAGHVEEILGLSECRGEHPFGGKYADALDRGEIGHAILIIVVSNRVNLPCGGWSVLFLSASVQPSLKRCG